MLTVNVKSKDGMFENIYEAESVQACRSTESGPTILADDPYDWVDIYSKGGIHHTVSGVNVFVMNDKGQTVSRYLLSGEESAQLVDRTVVEGDGVE